MGFNLEIVIYSIHLYQSIYVNIQISRLQGTARITRGVVRMIRYTQVYHMTSELLIPSKLKDIILCIQSIIIKLAYL